MLESFIHTFKHSLMITAFVLAMMLLIEYLTVRTKNKFLKVIGKNVWVQVIIASLLGVIPGCMGTFVVVSLYAHRVMGFPALVAAFIATSGDEAFVMFSEITKEAFLINGVLLAVGIFVGFILILLMKNKNFMLLKNNLLHSHNEPECVSFDKKRIIQEYKNISFQRALLLFGSIVFLFFLIISNIDFGHAPEHIHEHIQNAGHKNWSVENVSLIFITLLVIFVVSTVPEHFLVEHLWKHTIKKHLVKIFLWTFGALFFIEILMHFFDISQETLAPIAEKYYLLILLFALLIGIIPESGPNLVFIFLFSAGIIPISILIANSIVQDGHGGLPLLAESKKSFFYAKAINIFVGLIFGLVGYFFGF